MPYYSFYLTKEHLLGRLFDKELFASYSRTTLLLLWIWFDINNTNSNIHNGLKSFPKSRILTFEEKKSADEANQKWLQGPVSNEKLYKVEGQNSNC